MKVVSYINPNFPNIPTMVQNFQTLFENFALVNMSKLVISKSDISKTDISDLPIESHTYVYISRSSKFYFQGRLVYVY